jgi:hypothetical protein
MLSQIIMMLIISASIGLKPEKHNVQNFREIILFAYADDDQSIKKQLEILNSDPKGLAERDLKISVKIWRKDEGITHQKFKIAKNQFTFILIGKDGGEKFRSTSVVTLENLYSIIDAMPMRRYEMRKSDN